MPIRALLSEYPTRRASDVCLRAAQGILDALPPRFVPVGEREAKALHIIAERLRHGDTDGFSLCWHLEQAGIVHGCSKLVAALEMHAESEVDLALEAAIADWMIQHEPSAEEVPQAAPGWIATGRPSAELRYGWQMGPDATVFTCKPSAEAEDDVLARTPEGLPILKPATSPTSFTVPELKKAIADARR